ncbi:MAG: ABC-F family ATP-binding cassette domain-containing protein [Chloroflexaceae bacterium]
MIILSVEGVSKQYGEHPLFEEVTFGLEQTDRVGVIGVNGSGKTTLLRIVAGLEPPDSGRVTLSNNMRAAYLPQNPALAPDLTVLDTVFAGGAPKIQLLREYERTTEALAHAPNDQQLQARLNELMPRMDALAAWEAETAAHTILSRLGLADYINTPVGQLSGGQRRRVAMAQVLIDQPDLLILDEPTNHIDTETITWLEDLIARSNLALLVVTHDRYFLDRVTTRMIELDRGRVYTHSGNYSQFLEQKATREAQAIAAEDARQNLLRKELTWLRRGAQARTTKQKAHVQRVHNLMEQTPETAQGAVNIDVAARRIGKRVLELEHVTKNYGDQPLIRDFSFSLRRDDRLGIIGPNGSGKSTLLNLIAGRIPPDSGQIQMGETIHLGYYDQESIELNESQRVIDYIRDASEHIQDAEGALVSAAQMLERFLFPRDAQWSLIKTLSGGERRRLYLLRTLMFAPNLLLLDEPTNDLDITTLTILEDYLDNFNGAVILVSHDRYFLDRTVQHLLFFDGDGTIREYPGGYSLFQAYRTQEEEERAATQAAQARPRSNKSERKEKQTSGPRRLNYKERRELAALEERITALETQKAELGERLNHVGEDYQAYQQLAAELAQVDADLEAAFERWTELAELAEQ